MLDRLEELMHLGSWGSKALILDYRGGMSHFHFHWVSSVWLSSLYNGVRSGVQLHFGRYVILLVLEHLFICCFSSEVWHNPHPSLSSVRRLQAFTV